MVAIAMATPKAKKKKAAKKTTKALPARKAGRKTKALAARKAAKKAKALPARKPAKKGKAVPASARKAVKKAKAAPPPRRAATKRAAPKAAAAARKVPAKKAKAEPVAKPATKPSVARARPLQRRYNAGHLDPKYAADLLAMSEPREEDPAAFLERPRSTDDLVEELGEEFVQEVTSAEYKAEDRFNAEVPEETGGPFVETSGGTEFAPGTDPSNPESATREPFPST
jgi:hypothetical protein